MRRFNGWTLAMKLTKLRGGGKHLCRAGRLMAMERGLSERLGTWREPMRKVR